MLTVNIRNNTTAIIIRRHQLSASSQSLYTHCTSAQTLRTQRLAQRTIILIRRTFTHQYPPYSRSRMSTFVSSAFPNSPTTQGVSGGNGADVLGHSVDRFNGIIINIKTLPHDDTTRFTQMLTQSLTVWSRKNHRGVWLQLDPQRHAQLIAPALSVGFEFHHANPQMVMLTCWLPAWAKQHALTSQPLDDSASSTVRSPSPEPSQLPSYHSASLGVGGLVIHRQGSQLLTLTVLERFGHRPDFWKMSGGAVDNGETLTAAVIRELKEETNVDIVFHSVIAFRHLTNYRFNGADVYFICVCRTAAEVSAASSATASLSSTSSTYTVPPPTPTPQPNEIAECKWMDLWEWMELASTAWFTTQIYPALVAEISVLYPDYIIPDKVKQRVRDATTAVTATAVNGVNTSKKVVGMHVEVVTSTITGVKSQFYVVQSSL